MAIRPLNSVGGFAVGELANVVVLPNGVITTSTANLTANLIANAVYTDNYKYANGVNVDFQTAAGNATEIQFKATGANDLAASANLTFNNSSSLLNLQGTANISTVNVLGAGNALYIANSLRVDGTIYGNINGNIAAAGTNTQVLFNDNGTVNAVSGMTFVKTSNLLTISGNIDVQNLSNANLLSANYVSVSSNLTSGNANLGNLATANYVNVATDLTVGTGTGGNITGANLISANYVNVSSNLTSGNASLGNLATANYLTITNNANINGTLTAANIVVGGNIIPNANVTYNLGNNTNRFKDLWLSGNTIELGGANIKADGSNVTITTALGGSFTINGTQNANSGYIVNGTSNVLVSPSSNVTISAQGNANVFTVTGNGVNITGTLAAGDTTITGNLTVTGTTTSVNSTVTQIVDPLFELGGGANGAALATNDNKERGLLMHYYKGSAPVDAFMGWMNGNSEFAFGSNVSVSNNNVTINTLGNIRAGNANLGNLATANYVNVSANITAGNADLGNLATANYFTVNNAITVSDMLADSIVGHKANVNVSSNTVIDTFTANKYRAAKYVIKASNDTGYQVLEAIIVHDNADSYATIYGSISTTLSDIVEIDTYLVGSNIELKANAVTASANTKVRLLGTYIAD